MTAENLLIAWVLAVAGGIERQRELPAQTFADDEYLVRMDNPPKHEVPIPDCGVAWVSEVKSMLDSLDPSERSLFERAIHSPWPAARQWAWEEVGKRRLHKQRTRTYDHHHFELMSNYRLGIKPHVTPPALNQLYFHSTIPIEPIRGWIPPPGSVPWDFNGQRYWVVPLDGR